MVTTIPLEERETIIVFNEKEATAEITTWNPTFIERFAELEIAGETGTDGSTEFVCPKGLITIGKVRKTRAPRNLSREDKNEKLRQLRVGKTIKRLMAEGKSEKAARTAAEKIYGKPGKATEAATPGNDPFSKENAPQRPSTDEVDETSEVEEEAPVLTKAQAAKARKAKKANAGLDD